MGFKVISENFLLDRLEDQCHQQYKILVAPVVFAPVVLAPGPSVEDFHDTIIGNLTSQPQWLRDRLRLRLDQQVWPVI
jgi:hypothetical protein